MGGLEWEGKGCVEGNGEGCVKVKGGGGNCDVNGIG